jgi:hypothetical protein
MTILQRVLVLLVVCTASCLLLFGARNFLSPLPTNASHLNRIIHAVMLQVPVYVAGLLLFAFALYLAVYIAVQYKVRKFGTQYTELRLVGMDEEEAIRRAMARLRISDAHIQDVIRYQKEHGHTVSNQQE